MPLKAKVTKLDKTQRLLLFFTASAECATTNRNSENIDEDEALKPSSSTNIKISKKS